MKHASAFLVLSLFVWHLAACSGPSFQSNDVASGPIDAGFDTALAESESGTDDAVPGRDSEMPDAAADGAPEGAAATDAEADGGGTSADATEEQKDAASPVCGDGHQDPGEECDDGNSSSGDGCEPGCVFSCHADAECDDGNPCTGDRCNPSARGKQCSNTIAVGEACDDGNGCTQGDTCDDAGVCAAGPNQCPCQTDPDCAPAEDGDLCNGTLVCVAHECVVDPATVVHCDGSGDTGCTKNVCIPASGACAMQAAADGAPCDDGYWCTAVDRCKAGSCEGSSAPCQLACEECNEAERVCAPAEGQCAIDGACYAAGESNPTNECEECNPGTGSTVWAPKAEGAACDNGVYCDGEDACDGSGTCTAKGGRCAASGCSVGCDEAGRKCVAAPPGLVCRAASAPCELPALCNGTSLDCPASNPLAPATTVCRPGAGPCDKPEQCTGASRDCPVDAKELATTVCRAAAGDCDAPERCSGASNECPADLLLGTDHECRAKQGDCDVAEACTGISAACPADQLVAATVVCRAAVPGGCDVAETCTGTDAACPQDAFKPSSVTCRAAAGPCDVAERCPGDAAQCPVDSFKPEGTACDDQSACTWADACTATHSCSGQTVALAAPVPRSPLNGDYVSVKPRMTWAAPASDGCPAAVTYDVQIDDDCTSPQSCTFPSPLAFGGLSTTALVVSAALPVSAAQPVGRRYYWRVRAVRNGVASAWSAVRYMEVGRAQGDINGDGYSDVVVGAQRNYDTSAWPYRGAIYVFYRKAGGALSSSPDVAILNPELNGYFGQSVATADVNGDGYGDIIVGAWQNASYLGMAYVLFGGKDPLPASPSAKLELTNPSGTSSGHFGFSVAAAGDVNADGYADWAVGAFESGPGAQGLTYIYHGAAGLALAPSPKVIANPDGEPGGDFGYSVASAGDVNGDGFADLVVGAPRQDHGITDQGNAFVYLGSASGLSSSFATRLQGPSQAESARFGHSVSSAGDSDGDGFSGVLVGSPSLSSGQGAAYLYAGAPGGLADVPSAMIANPDPQGGAAYGTSVASADLNGDGYGDMLIGAPGYKSSGATSDGAVFVFRGSSGGPGAWVRVANPQPGSGGSFGQSIGCMGDLDQDGKLEVVIGAPYQATVPDSGRYGAAYVYVSDMTVAPIELRQSASVSGSGFGISTALLGAPGVAPDRLRRIAAPALPHPIWLSGRGPGARQECAARLSDSHVSG